MQTTVDTSAFQAALRRHLTSSSRELPEVLNMHAAGVLMRTFLILEPKDPQGERSQVRSELTREIGERTHIAATGKRAGQRIRLGRARQFQAKHRILQWLRAKTGKAGLYGDEMRREAGRFQARRVASVGSLKSLVVRMLRAIMPGFTQFGGSTKKAGGRQVQPNSMLVRLAAQYQHAASNVGVARTARASGRRASSGWNPTAQASGTIGVKDGQEGKVDARYQAALARAFSDETAEMTRHLEGAILDNAQASGFAVK